MQNSEHILVLHRICTRYDTLIEKLTTTNKDSINIKFYLQMYRDSELLIAQISKFTNNQREIIYRSLNQIYDLSKRFIKAYIVIWKRRKNKIKHIIDRSHITNRTISEETFDLIKDGRVRILNEMEEPIDNIKSTFV